MSDSTLEERVAEYEESYTRSDFTWADDMQLLHEFVRDLIARVRELEAAYREQQERVALALDEARREALEERDQLGRDAVAAPKETA